MDKARVGGSNIQVNHNGENWTFVVDPGNGFNAYHIGQQCAHLPDERVEEIACGVSPVEERAERLLRALETTTTRNFPPDSVMVTAHGALCSWIAQNEQNLRR